MPAQLGNSTVVPTLLLLLKGTGTRSNDPASCGSRAKVSLIRREFVGMASTHTVRMGTVEAAGGCTNQDGLGDLTAQFRRGGPLFTAANASVHLLTS